MRPLRLLLLSLGGLLVVPCTLPLGTLERLSGAYLAARPSLEGMEELLPVARPSQPWPYRSLAGARASGVQQAESHAAVARVSHAVLRGVTPDMMAWWFAGGVLGSGPYPGDGRTWPNYLAWHPRDHVHQRPVRASSTTGGGASSSGGTERQLWEICEWIGCPEPGGVTAAAWPRLRDAPAVRDSLVRAVTEVKQLDARGLWLSVPSRTGLGHTLWQLRHTWAATPQGLAVNSTQVVGVVERTWRPLAYARRRNAVVRGLYAAGRDPVALLNAWLTHCVEEMGNLEHILPPLYEAAQAKPQRRDGGGSGSGGGSRADARGRSVDEL